ncbi:MAG: glycosyltransferase [Bacillota bacterium]
MAFWLSLVVLAASVAIYAHVAWGWRRLGALRNVAPILPNPPRVSIVVPARDEGTTIEPALRSLLALEYPDLEIVAIDDRSADATGEILDRLGREFPRLQILHVRELPARWLGKNHALHLGAQLAAGTYILFADADVVLEPTSLTRAVSHCEERALDHLTILPDVPARTLFLAFSMLMSFIGLLAYFRPWRARRSLSHGMGVGAFNLVRADAYRSAGGHERLRLQVLDDIELGRMMARPPFRQDALLGRGMVSVEIYRSAREMVRGIQKNVFSFLDYSVVKLLAATALTFALSVWPWIGLLATSGTTRLVNLGSALSTLVLYAHLAPRLGYVRRCLIYLPIGGVLSIFFYWQIAIATWIRGGIVWRGTFYPLAEIRRR